jgi:ferredoxin
MSSAECPVGSWYSLPKSDLQLILDQLASAGYRVVGPQVADGAVVYRELHSIEQLPRGVLDEQDGGRYRLHHDSQAGYFDHVVGPHSVKQFLFPPREVVQEFHRDGDSWRSTQPASTEPQKTAVIGVRSCDLHAIAIQDQVFLHGPYVDPGYQARRAALFLVSVQCRRAAATCFCHSMNTGPRAKSGFDLALTELDDRFVMEVGSQQGGTILRAIDGVQLCSDSEKQQAAQLSLGLEQAMLHRNQQPPPTNQPRPRHLATDGIHDLLLQNLNHPRWEQVADRCLSCTNCTLVCPTCFCSTVEEVSDLTGDHVRRERAWSSCFTTEHSHLSSGVVRQSTASRYRQWLTHKLATWIDQYGTSGCVGCGRCITWCPVGIDLTEEVAAIREQAP